ncbi:MAG: glycosyltransferase family 87 protein [Planctomycetota bacterium]
MSDLGADRAARRKARVAWALFALLWLGLIAGPASRFVRGAEGDFIHFYQAGRAVLEGTDLYASGRGGYIYPPAPAVLMAPLALVSMGAAGAIWVVIGGLMLCASVVLVTRECVRRVGGAADGALVPIASLLATIAIADKVRGDLRLGQTDPVVLLAIVLALVWAAKRPLLAGVALGLGGLVKYQTIVFVPYFLLRNRWREAGAMLAAAVVGSLLPALVFGWGRNLEYLATGFAGLAEMLGVRTDRPAASIFPLTWERSVSLPSTFGRLAERLAGEGGEPSFLIVAGGSGVVAIACLLLGWWMFARRGLGVLWRNGRQDETTPTRRAGVACEWAGLIVAVLVFSPQTTMRHMVLLLIPAALASVLLLRVNWGRARWPLGVAIAIGALALVLPPGGGRWDPLAYDWRGVGGASWVWLVVLFTTIWYALDAARADERGARADGSNA